MRNLKDLLGIDLPIIQAPMAGVQGSAMAVAVSSAGGLGSLPCAMLTSATIYEELQTITANTSKPYNVNFFCHDHPAPDTVREAAWRKLLTPYYQEFQIDPEKIPVVPGRMPFSHEAADVLSEFKPAVVSFHFGLPSSELIACVRSWGARILSTATTVAEACWLEQQGADAIIAQGVEAGGHRGMFLTNDLATQTGTFELLREILKKVKVPVIAAGGITNAQGVAAAIAAGAVGVQIGTAYMLCTEATASAVHRAALKSEATRHTAITNLFTGRPARGIVNRLVQELGAMHDAVPPFPLAVSAVAPLRAKAEQQGSGDFSPLWCGENVSGCQEISAARLTLDLVVDL